MGDLANRLWSAGIAIPLLVVLLASNTGKLGLLLAVIIRSSFEYYGCVFQIGKNEQLSTRWCNLARWHTWSSCIIPLVAFCFDFGHSVVALVFVLIGHSLLFIFFVSWKRIPFEPALFGTMCMALFGHFYIEFLLSHAVFLHNLWTCGKSVLGTWSIVLPIALALIGDNGAYVGGKFFGTHKVVPHLSPNKSLEGFLGAIFWTIGFSWIVFSLYRQLLHHPIAMAVSRIEMIIIGMLVGILGILGDLFESFIKRCFNRKDLADFFPGWGGLMDRIDSIIFAVPAVFYYLVIFHNAELNAPWCPSSQVEIISWISELMRLS